MRSWCLGRDRVLSRVPVSTQSSSVPALALPASVAALAALVLLFPLPELAADVPGVPLPGVMLTVDPSGIVVVPVNPVGPERTLLDMPPGEGGVRPAASA